MPKWTMTEINSRAYGAVSFGTDTDQSVSVDPFKLDSNGVISLAAVGASSYDTTIQRTGPGTISVGGVPVGTGATVAGAGQNVTGVTAETLLASGLTVAAGTLAAGQVYRFVAWGTLTTTVTTQTVDLRLRYGGLAGTQLIDMGAQNPSSGAVITGARWSATFDIVATANGTLSVMATDSLNYFPSTETGAETNVGAGAAQFVITVQPSATAVIMNCTGFLCERVA